MRGVSRHIGRSPHLGLPGVPNCRGRDAATTAGCGSAGHPVNLNAERRGVMPKTEPGTGLVGASWAAWHGVTIFGPLA
jgi:hypothetical protein